jgi:hypothetical protein
MGHLDNGSNLGPDRHDIGFNKTEQREGEPFRRVVKDPNPLTRVLTGVELHEAAFRMYQQAFKDNAVSDKAFAADRTLCSHYLDLARVAAETWGLKFND